MPNDEPKRKTTTSKKAPARKPAAAKPRKAAARTRKPKVTPEQVAERAYFLHLDEGGDPFHNWLRAERELVGA